MAQGGNHIRIEQKPSFKATIGQLGPCYLNCYKIFLTQSDQYHILLAVYSGSIAVPYKHALSGIQT